MVVGYIIYAFQFRVIKVVFIIQVDVGLMELESMVSVNRR